MKKLFLVLIVAILNFAPLLAQDNPAANSPHHKSRKDRETIIIEPQRRHHRHHRRHRHHHHHHHRMIGVIISQTPANSQK
ncbi:MAG TPA: hypothetical protein VMF08_21450 [Candidatus Sulfotelmatobacter sp.]|nr:hypothetical protein [Candidatus Sulfotelmatobacter sp.]